MSSSEANALAEKVLALDPAIISVGVISHNGTPLGGAISKSHQSVYSYNPEAWQASSFRAAQIMGSIKADDRVLSPIESIILVRRNSKSLLIWVPQSVVILAVMFQRTTSGSALADKIKKACGID